MVGKKSGGISVYLRLCASLLDHHLLPPGPHLIIHPIAGMHMGAESLESIVGTKRPFRLIIGITLEPHTRAEVDAVIVDLRSTDGNKFASFWVNTDHDGRDHIKANNAVDISRSTLKEAVLPFQRRNGRLKFFRHFKSRQYFGCVFVHNLLWR